LKGFPDDRPTVDGVTYRAFDVAENDRTGGWHKGSPPKTPDCCASARRDGCFDGVVERRSREPMRFGAAANGGAGRHRPEGPARWEHRVGSVSARTATWPRTVAPAGEVAFQNIFGVADHGKTDRWLQDQTEG
jgi:hypothetical protein